MVIAAVLERFLNRAEFGVGLGRVPADDLHMEAIVTDRANPGAAMVIHRPLAHNAKVEFLDEPALARLHVRHA